MTTYLANSFSPSMLSQLPADVEFQRVNQKEFCEAISGSINAVGHQGTVDLINAMCNINLTVNRVTIKTSVGDTIYIVVLNFRLEEGKVLTSEEIRKAYNENKILLIRAKVYGNVLSELSSCEGICDEKTYDSLASKAKRG